MFECNIHITES